MSGHVSIVFHTKDVAPSLTSVRPLIMQRPELGNPEHFMTCNKNLEKAMDFTFVVNGESDFSIIKPPSRY